jgi:hypothetical protein
MARATGAEQDWPSPGACLQTSPPLVDPEPESLSLSLSFGWARLALDDLGDHLDFQASSERQFGRHDRTARVAAGFTQNIDQQL